MEAIDVSGHPELKALPGVRSTAILVGTYPECCDFLDERSEKWRKGETLMLVKNLTDRPGSHMIVAHAPPSRLRDAEDLLRKVLELEPFGENAIDDQVQLLVSDVQEYFDGSS